MNKMEKPKEDEKHKLDFCFPPGLIKKGILKQGDTTFLTTTKIFEVDNRIIDACLPEIESREMRIHKIVEFYANLWDCGLNTLENQELLLKALIQAMETIKNIPIEKGK